MGMGHAANFADVITVENLKKICPDTWDAFESLCEKHVDNGWEGFIYGIYQETPYYDKNGDDIEDVGIIADLDKSYQTLVNDFHDRTGLDLDCGYHDSENCGDRYDDVDGAYFHVDGCYVESPELKSTKEQYGDLIERNFFVTYG